MNRAMTLKQVCEHVGISHKTVYKWQELGLLPYPTLNPGSKMKMYDRKLVDQFLDNPPAVQNHTPQRKSYLPEQKNQKKYSPAAIREVSRIKRKLALSI